MHIGLACGGLLNFLLHAKACVANQHSSSSSASEVTSAGHWSTQLTILSCNCTIPLQHILKAAASVHSVQISLTHTTTTQHATLQPAFHHWQSYQPYTLFIPRFIAHHVAIIHQGSLRFSTRNLALPRPQALHTLDLAFCLANQPPTRTQAHLCKLQLAITALEAPTRWVCVHAS